MPLSVSRALPQERAGAGPARTYRLSLACAALTCALMPAYVIRWKVGFIPTTLLEAALLITLALFAFEAIQTKQRLAWRSPFTIPALGFLLAGAISVFVAPSPRDALGLYRAYLVEPFLFFVVIATVTTSARRAWLVLAGLAVAGATVSFTNLYVVLQALRAHVVDLALQTPVAIYLSANAVALFLVPLIAVAGSLLLHAPDWRVRLGSAGFLAIALPAAVLSFSRGGYVAIALLALILAVTHPRRGWLLSGLLVAGLVASRLPLIQRRAAHEFDLGDPYNSLTGRLPLWRATLRMLRDHPVFGTGLSSFGQRIAPYWTVEEAGRGLIYPHNIVLNLWTETGLLGVASFLACLIQGLRLSWRGWRKADAHWRAMHLGVFLALVAIVVHGLVDVPYWKNDLSLQFWTLLGITWAGLRSQAAGTR
jgi:O-antigen ligase